MPVRRVAGISFRLALILERLTFQPVPRWIKFLTGLFSDPQEQELLRTASIVDVCGIAANEQEPDSAGEHRQESDMSGRSTAPVEPGGIQTRLDYLESCVFVQLDSGEGTQRSETPG